MINVNGRVNLTIVFLITKVNSTEVSVIQSGECIIKCLFCTTYTTRPKEPVREQRNKASIG